MENIKPEITTESSASVPNTLRELVDNPNDPMTSMLISDVEFYCTNLNMPKEIVENLVCRAYSLGQISSIVKSSNAIKRIIDSHKTEK